MKNIWILNHYASVSGGRHYKFAENLIKKGYNVKVFAASTVHNAENNMISDSNKYIYKEVKGIPFVFVKARDYTGNGKKRIQNMLDYALGLLSVSKQFDSEKPDVIYASSVHPLTWLAGYRLAKRYNAKFIAETRDLWPETLVAMGEIGRNSIPARLLYKLEKFIYKNADKLIFTFKGGKDYVENIGLDSSKVRYINNGVDIEEFDNNKKANTLEDTDLDSLDTYKILYTGSMGRANALNYLVEAGEIIQNKGFKNIKIILFGDGYQKQELEKYIREKGITNVIFKGKVEKKYVPYILSKSNLNVILSQPISLYKYGVSPNKMFDYFASGVPVISNMECGYDMLEEYKCGITVEAGSAESLAEGILKFYNMTEEEYNAYCNNALKAAQDFDFKVLTDKLERVILED